MAEKEKLTLVVFSGELDRALAAFILATTAAAMDIEVTMFFTFWGLNIIKKNEGPIKSKGIIRKMFNVVNRGGTKRLTLSKFHMLGIGEFMIKKLMKEIKHPTLDELIKMSYDMGVKMIACTTSCGLMGVPEEAFRSEVDSLSGAAYFLDEARNSKTTLFI
jgi:peroxiredoxin family protein